MLLKLALAFFLIALLSAIFSFSGSAGAARLVGRTLFFTTLVLFVGSIVLALATDNLAL